MGVDLALNSRERALRLFGHEDPENHPSAEIAGKVGIDDSLIAELRDAQKGMEEAKEEYPDDIEKAFWLVTAVIIAEFCFVFIAMLLTVMGDKCSDSFRKCSSVFMDFCLFAGEFATIGAVIFLLYKVLTQERRVGYTGIM